MSSHSYSDKYCVTFFVEKLMLEFFQFLLLQALKTKHDTPKYGLIYHAQLVGSSGTKLKGKVSRMLAAKASLACRVDALGEETNTDHDIEHRAKVGIWICIGLIQSSMMNYSG